MKKFNVYGVSDWPEELGKQFAIFLGKEFESKEHAKEAAQHHYDDVEIIVEECE
ncbi:hypothetical protein D3C80_448440 [compost metagenome]